ncbi:probable sulfate transporter 3.5 isoform X3 [Hevea brasiliensis]|uniref:probable sulfate transporter 3.5 isoform X3 n=1 Tax=Hevea brasiliensis TaxID=3981 RepID=UPI0025D63958|nr:probable sulfate transporter 3.5 isoform X3 [Hevea brasiliensis]
MSTENPTHNEVNFATPRSFGATLKSHLKETFFPDDPFRQFRNEKSCGRVVKKAVQYFIPIFEWLPNYNLRLFRFDLLAGITIASLAIPQGISYAKLANLPPVIGLYSSFVPPLIYAVFGNSKHLAVGTVAACSLLIANTIGEKVSFKDDPTLYLHLVFTATFFTGIFQTILGLLRLGILVDFLSHPTITGFMGGTATLICLQQLKGIFGLKHFTTKTDVVSVLRAIFENRDEWRWQSVVVGIIFLIFLQFTWFLEGVAIGRSFAIMKNEQVDGNKEMIAFGLMNIVGSFTSCYLTTGPFSKTAVNFNAGCRTAMSNIVMAICMMLTLLFLAPFFSYTPLVALSAIIMSAMLGLIDCKEIYHLFKVDKFDFLICMAGFIGVAFISMDNGLMMSIGLALVRTILYAARPTTCKLGKMQDSYLYRDTEQYPGSTGVPGVLALQLGSPIYFANSNYIRERILRWIQEEDDVVNDEESVVEHVLLDLSGVTSIDTTGIETLIEIRKILEAKSIKLSIINPRLDVMEKMIRSHFVDKVGKESIFLCIEDAVEASLFTPSTQKKQHQVFV